MNLGRFNRILMQTLLLPVLALTFVALILVWNITAAQKTVTTIQASDQTITDATETEKLIVDEETALRGYQLTGDRSFLLPFRASERPLDGKLDELRKNLIAQHQSSQLVDDIDALHERWRVSFAEPLVGQTQGGGDLRDVDTNLRGKFDMDEIRAKLNSLLSDENHLRDAEVARWKRQTRNSIIVLVVLALGAGAIISIFTVSWLHRVSDAYQDTLEDLRQTTQATFESEERLRATLTSIGDGVIVCNAAGEIELLNTVAQQLTGWAQENAFHRGLEEVFAVVSEGTGQPVESTVQRVKRANGVVGPADPTILRRKDGTSLTIEQSGAPIRDRAGELTGVVIVFRDITNQRRTQTALLAAEKLAVAGRLAASIAHEIHNPLDSVVNLLYLIEAEEDAATSAQYLELAQQELRRMGQVSRAMLGLYREADAPVTVNIKEVLDSSLVLVARQLKDNRVTVNARVPDGLEVQGFPAELRQVFTNLLVNSIDAVSDGGTIQMFASRSTVPAAFGGQPGVVVVIEDNGTGIATEAVGQVFDPFFTTKGERGTGLGLWVSRGIVEKHGGSIAIRSRTGTRDHGTTITVLLPLRGPATAGG